MSKTRLITFKKCRELAAQKKWEELAEYMKQPWSMTALDFFCLIDAMDNAERLEKANKMV